MRSEYIREFQKTGRISEEKSFIKIVRCLAEKQWAALESWALTEKLTSSQTNWTSLVMEANYTGDCFFGKLAGKFIKFKVLHGKHAGTI